MFPSWLLTECVFVRLVLRSYNAQQVFKRKRLFNAAENHLRAVSGDSNRKVGAGQTNNETELKQAAILG